MKQREGKNMPMVEVNPSAGNNPTFDMGLSVSENFDLALIKTTTNTNGIRLNDEVTFEIEVFNQGGVPTSEYQIVDYITDG